MSKLTMAILAATMLLPMGAAAQIVSAGDRVRVHRTDDTFRVGRLVADSPDGMTLRLENGQEIVLLREQVTGIERSVGERRSMRRALGWTVAVSALTGAAVGAAVWSPCRDTGWFSCFMHPASRGDAAGLGALGGAVVGLPLGLIVGAAVRQEEWETIDTPWGTSVTSLSVVPTSRGGIGVSGRLLLGR